MSRPTIDDDKKTLLAKLEECGGASGNTSLRKLLGWTNEDRYWRTRNSLMEDGAVTTGRGKGGSVRSVGLDAAAPDSDAGTSGGEAARSGELAHYEELERVLRDHWLRRQGLENARVNVCAHQGKKQTGGKWSRPDLIAAYVETYEYVPGKRVSVTTFEVKMGEATDIASVYEAAAHRRTVHNAYLLVVGEFASGDLESIVRTACVQQGIGLLQALKAADVESWEELVQPRRNEPEPRELNNTVFNFLVDKEWLKREVR